MGVTIESEHYSIDLGYGGFANIRMKVAELTAPDIFEHYKYLNKGMFLSGKERKEFFEEYDKKIMELDEKYQEKKSNILDFLYSCDAGAVMDYHHCIDIYEVIKDYDDNVLYGYVGRPDCVRFKDFKALVKDCVDTKTSMEWF